MIREAIIALVEEGRHLSEDEAASVMREIMEGAATEAQFGAFVTALRLRGETVDEITGLARVMREKSLHVQVNIGKPLLDTCGTGGSSRKVFNASTAAAFVAAGAGAIVAKHGNRAMTSKSGAADLLEALGANIALTPEQVAQVIERTGVGFMFAPSFHPAMKFAAPLRPQLGIRTVFNILGPLTNPAGAQCHVMGAASPEVASRLAEVLARLGMRHALVVAGEDGLDDLTVTAPSTSFEVRGGTVTRGTITPADMGLETHRFEEIVGGTPELNAQIVREVFRGEGPPAVRDLILATAGAGLYVTGLAATIRQGVEMAKASITSGDAAARLASFVEATRRVSAGK